MLEHIRLRVSPRYGIHAQCDLGAVGVNTVKRSRAYIQSRNGARPSFQTELRPHCNQVADGASIRSCERGFGTCSRPRYSSHSPRPRAERYRLDAGRFRVPEAARTALVAAVTLPSLDLFVDGSRIETAAGEHRTVRLADGSSIEINGASAIMLDKDRPRFARLESGEAMFHVVHNDRDPFVVEAGPARIVDLGTAFNVVRGERRTSVAVSEGVVLYNPHRDKVRVAAGQAIDTRDGDVTPPNVRPVDIANVGGWRTGLLVYTDASLASVAEDLRRTAGMDVRVSPEAAGQSFRGALIVDKDNSPKWDPPTPEAVTDDWIDAIFAPLPESEKWTPLT